MAEYIEREVLLKKLHEAGGCGAEPNTWADGYDKAIDHAYGIAQKIPAAEVEPVRHGRWKHYKKQGVAVCMECSFERNLDENFGRAIACPNCGARMDLGGADNG